MLNAGVLLGVLDAVVVIEGVRVVVGVNVIVGVSVKVGVQVAVRTGWVAEAAKVGDTARVDWLAVLVSTTGFAVAAGVHPLAVKTQTTIPTNMVFVIILILFTF
jgi:hypothetical protein